MTVQLEVQRREWKNRGGEAAKLDAPHPTEPLLPLAESLDDLCSFAAGMPLHTFLRIDIHQLLQGVPERYRRTEVGTATTRALRSALEHLR